MLNQYRYDSSMHRSCVVLLYFMCNFTVKMILFLLSFICIANSIQVVPDFVTKTETELLTNILEDIISYNETIPRLAWINDEDIKLLLYTRMNPEKYQLLRTNDTKTLKESRFNFKCKLKLIVHGWITNGTSFVPELIKTAYLKMLDVNVIVLDWSIVARSKYIFASYYVAKIARHLTDFLEFLVDKGFKTENIHLIGHSLGAHVAGIAGHYYYLQRKPINDITGLDPAYPLYKYTNDDWRLDKSDASHVEVIHTCAGYLGFPTPLGHIDYYPNGGTAQPGCGVDLIGTCAHDRSVIYFAESIVSQVPFIAVQCDDYNELYQNGYCNNTKNDKIKMSGLIMNYGKNGIFYLKTSSDLPFALGTPANWHVIT